jgi:hypothetical protein
MKYLLDAGAYIAPIKHTSFGWVWALPETI